MDSNLRAFRVDSGEKLYLCPHCEHRRVRDHRYLVYRLDDHSVNTARVMVCDACNRLYTYEQRYAILQQGDS